MILRFESDGLELIGRLSKPEKIAKGHETGLILCHGFPSLSTGDNDIAKSYYDLADLISEQLGWTVFAITLRGCGSSKGNFSNAASKCKTLAGVAAVSPPSDFNDWIAEPEDLLNYAREVGVISDPKFPTDLEGWTNELCLMQTIEAAEAMGEKPLLLVHGSDDRVVPSFDSRVLADAHGSADLRIIDGATHRLRFDPRTTAVLIGWLDRIKRVAHQKNEPHSFTNGGQ